METIRQDGKIILHGNDGISIKMIFKNLTGKNFQGREYADYIRHIAIGSMGFSSRSTAPSVWPTGKITATTCPAASCTAN